MSAVSAPLPKALLIGVLLLAAGCASLDPRLYTLNARPGQVRPSVRATVVVLPPAIPRYLDRLEIMRNAGDNTRQAADNDWWDEPLKQMVPRVVAADLSQRLPQSDFVTEDAAAAAQAEWRVTIDVQGFDKIGNEVVLNGHVGLQSRGSSRSLDPLRVIVPISGSGIAAQVAAMSVALGQVADVLAIRLTQAAGADAAP